MRHTNIPKKRLKLTQFQKLVFLLFFIGSVCVYYSTAQPLNETKTQPSDEDINKDVLNFLDRVKRLNKKNTIDIKAKPIVLKRIFSMLKYQDVMQTLSVGQFYFPLFESSLKKHGLPEELKYLPVVESNLNSVAKSHAGAKGLWQFMTATGKQFGLEDTEYINTFNDPLLATDAACKYLKYLYKELDDWELALAAYNCGIGRVKRLLKKTGKSTFWEIFDELPKETQLYVPSFMAAQFLFHFHQEYGLHPQKFPLKFEDIKMRKADTRLDLNQLANYTTRKDKLYLRFINPHLKTNIIPKGTYYYCF